MRSPALAPPSSETEAVAAENARAAASKFRRASDHALLGEALDVAPGIAEKLGENMDVVFAVTRRARVDRPADMSWRRAELHPQFRDRPCADLRSRDFRQPIEMSELRVVVASIFRRLADAGGNARGLQRRHAGARLVGSGPGADNRIELVLMGGGAPQSS